jgi:hypothetical protein
VSQVYFVFVFVFVFGRQQHRDAHRDGRAEGDGAGEPDQRRNTHSSEPNHFPHARSLVPIPTVSKASFQCCQSRIRIQTCAEIVSESQIARNKAPIKKHNKINIKIYPKNSDIENFDPASYKKINIIIH